MRNFSVAVLVAAMGISGAAHADVVTTIPDEVDLYATYGTGASGTFTAVADPGVGRIFLGFTLEWVSSEGQGDENDFVTLNFNGPQDGINAGLKSNTSSTNEDFIIRNGSNGEEYAPQQWVIPGSYRIVMGLLDTGGGSEYDAAWLWVNPTIADEGSPDATETPIAGPVSSVGYRHVNLDDTDIVHLRDIVVSTDFASAVPEPFTAGLLGLGGLALLRRRR